MAGVNQPVASAIRGLPENFVCTSRCKRPQKPRPIVCESRDNRFPETIENSGPVQANLQSIPISNKTVPSFYDTNVYFRKIHEVNKKLKKKKETIF